MLRDILKLTQLDPKFCASLFGVAPSQFYEWMAGTRPIPKFLLPELASVLGVLPSDVTEQLPQTEKDFAPAIWYKLRTQGNSGTADMELVGLIRKLCFNFSELQNLLGTNSDRCDLVFQEVRSQITQSAPIASQAHKAAEIFRSEFGWQQGGGLGIGDFMRRALRSSGLVIVESPVPDSDIEGCTFRVRSGDRDVTCIFANSYQSTWFRRNFIIFHEVCHGIFDLEGDPVSIDYKSGTGDDLKEKRANLFARECLTPLPVLTHLTSKFGVKWDRLSAETLARMMAECHVEQRTILGAARDYKLITPEQHDSYLALDCSPLLKEFTPHALSTREFLGTVSKEEHQWLFEKRMVKVGNRSILLPAGFLKAVMDLLQADRITVERASELTMMNRYDFEERFGALTPEAV
jgi:Zn-dependent peptidase ImmA (M78 family)